MANITPSGDGGNGDGGSGENGGGGSGGQSESLAERQSKITAACYSFVKIGFDPALFTVNRIRCNGFTETEFFKLIESFSSITNLDDLKSLFDAARDSVHRSFSNELSRFVGYVTWLKGNKDGKKLFDDVLRKKNPEDENKEFSKADVQLAQMLVDYVCDRKVEYICIQREIEELNKRQIELEAEYTGIGHDLKHKVGPLAAYEEIPIRLLRVQAHKLYLHDCTSKGIPAIPITYEMGFVRAVNDFGDIVRKNHFVKFLNDPIQKEQIENFLKHMIVRLKHTSGGYKKFVVADSSEPFNETVNIVNKCAFDLFEEISDEPESKRKRARLGKQPKEEEEHGETGEKV